MKLIFGNHKMNLMSSEIDDYLSFFATKELPNVYFCPSNIYLNKFIEKKLNTASQDVAFASNGAYTGDVSAKQLKSMGVNYSLVGHSERRKNYHDSLFVNQKIKNLLENDMCPILCIGESKEEHENNETKSIITKELDDALLNIAKLENIIIAYEPIWSIGTGIIPKEKEIEEVISFIKDYLKSHYHVSLKVLYGGSVSNNNISLLETIPNIDGYLVGGCSIKKDEFLELIKKVNYE